MSDKDSEFIKLPVGWSNWALSLAPKDNTEGVYYQKKCECGVDKTYPPHEAGHLHVDYCPKYKVKQA
jgi:hypothetical protein